MVHRIKLKEMEKIYLTKTKEEVKLGDTITFNKLCLDSDFGQIYTTHRVLINARTLPILVSKGILTLENDRIIPADLMYYKGKVINKLGLSESQLDVMQKVSPSIVFSLLLKEIAIELDKKYSDHIENSPEIYVLSLLDGRITKANKAIIKNYRNFAAFRSLPDAKFACRILRDYFKEMYAKKK